MRNIFSSLWEIDSRNLPRHPHHHAKGHISFSQLKANLGRPTLSYGYMAKISLAVIPLFLKGRMEEVFADLERKICLARAE